MSTDRGTLLADVLRHMRDPALPKEAFDQWFESARLVAQNLQSEDALTVAELEIGEELAKIRLAPLAR